MAQRTGITASAQVLTSTRHSLELTVTPLDLHTLNPDDEIVVVVNGLRVKSMSVHQAQRAGLVVDNSRNTY